MADTDIRSDSVDVMRVMEQIRARIEERRGADYTEEQLRELANVKYDGLLDPGQGRRGPPGSIPLPAQADDPPPEFKFGTDTIYASSRGQMGKVIRLIRRLLNPVLRLFFNPDPMILAHMRQSEINEWTAKKFEARERLDALSYEVLDNLVVEMTRLSVEMKNHRMLVESVAGRLEFAERRARTTEPGDEKRAPEPAGGGEEAGDTPAAATRPRRRRRRSRRRSGDSAASAPSNGGRDGPGRTTAAAADTAGATTPDTAGDPPPAAGAETATAPPEPAPPPAAAEATPVDDPGTVTAAPAPDAVPPSDSEPADRDDP